MQDTSFLLAKRVITEKVSTLLHELKQEMEQSPLHPSFPFPAGTDFQQGKITKGENLKGLPFVILDFPRLFGQSNVFAFRSMFWWGNYFSFTLHLKGQPLEQFRKPLLRNLSKKKKSDILVYTGADEWQQDLNEQNSNTITPATLRMLDKMDFLKLSRKINTDEARKVKTEGVKTYQQFLSLMCD